MGKTAEIIFATFGLIASLSTFAKAVGAKISDMKAAQKEDTEIPDDVKDVKEEVAEE